MDHVTVDLDEMREMIGRLIEHRVAEHGPTLDLPFDFFWAIHDPRLGDPLESPEVTIGQVSETLSMLERTTETWEGMPAEILGTSLRWWSYVLAAAAAQLERGDA
ncbi:hypothetical protein [Sanguibacter suaedae]|uniref:Uncharacterized protein n=1 Tax=Sanguibacter suaedae TaxID=2795737 RepID=A0A934I806_9MICO|nr:hypothetical protein [Sanguibacter suaedae]MBI9113677.1 hypothetical protein [Sanguibacter suaedae]